MVRLAGVEPARAYAHYPLKVACLPFHHNRICSYKKNGASGQNRTVDTRIFSPLLYRLSYRGKFFVKKMATPIRFELTIFAVTGRHVNRYTTGPRTDSRQVLVEYIIPPAVYASLFSSIFNKTSIFLLSSRRRRLKPKKISPSLKKFYTKKDIKKRVTEATRLMVDDDRIELPTSCL